MSPKTFCYKHCSLIIRETSFYSRREYKDPQSDILKIMRDLGTFLLKFPQPKSQGTPQMRR